uniref:Uncharacterized protein n=1 Tax=Ditylenchus dipsaci TaxID=166011 RepID=A0A915DMB7_9BILA
MTSYLKMTYKNGLLSLKIGRWSVLPATQNAISTQLRRNYTSLQMHHNMHAAVAYLVYPGDDDEEEQLENPVLIAPPAALSNYLSTTHRYYQSRQIKGERHIKRMLWVQKMDGKPFTLPPIPTLPMERVSRRRPFAKCGLDYLGPATIQGQS